MMWSRGKSVCVKMHHMAELRHLLRSNLKFKHLQLIVAISDRLHIGRVAEHLHLSQPAVSKSLAEFESIVDAQLFERRSSGLVETPQGKVFVRYARQALAQVGRLGDALPGPRAVRWNSAATAWKSMGRTGICWTNSFGPKATGGPTPTAAISRTGCGSPPRW